ncbi:DUF6325 family protein [Agromyces mediolanus]|uniref:DUF6325 family protein n=1 Tax=Agromyces mediolanus TaxID=41986 RepID=UPI00166D47B3|nr:DUF6325 family protein [Agromyces mediolanus]GLJ71422.1 hypothetical protein GCM10017583_06780 [Agromyces mediolanus]
MAEFEYGPVEIVVVALQNERPSAGTLDALAELVEAGQIRLLDALLVSRDQDGGIEAIEIEDLGDELDVTALELPASGLVGHDDVAEFAETIDRGTSAVLLAVELVWAKRLASRFADAGGVVLESVRIPAPVVNQVLAEASTEAE